MAGNPSYVLLTIAVCSKTRTEFIYNFFQGVEAALKRYKIVLIGGDVSSAVNDIALSATVIGHADSFVQRSGARAGDRLYVTPTEIQRAYIKTDGKHSPAGEHWFRSEPGVVVLKFAVALSTEFVMGWLNLCSKTSDAGGKTRTMAECSTNDRCKRRSLIDLTRLCNESRVGAKLKEKYRVHRNDKAASCLGLSPLTLALSGGRLNLFLLLGRR
jgi:hypothetical protein